MLGRWLVVVCLAVSATAQAQTITNTIDFNDPTVTQFLATLSSPATVNIQDWSADLATVGQQLLQDCAGKTTAQCAGLQLGTSKLPGVTVSLANPTLYLSQSLKQLTGDCELVPDPQAARPVLSVTYCHREDHLRNPFACFDLDVAGCAEVKTGLVCENLNPDGSGCTVKTVVTICYGEPVDPPLVCAQEPDTDVTETTQTKTTDDFADAIVKLEIARQAATYHDGASTGFGVDNNARAFLGYASECRDKILFGLGDCCKGGIVDESTHNRSALASLGISYAIRGVEAVGSRHVRDILYTNVDLNSSLRGLGQGLSGLADNFSPAFSYYGLEVSVSQGVVSFGFDPASFAVAVALAVVSSLLECTQEEKLLGLRVGNKLCRMTRRWCSKRTLGFCRERREAYCCHNSQISRILNEAAATQLSEYASNACTGILLDDLARLDFAQIDFSEVIAEMNTHNIDVDAMLARYRNDNAGQTQQFSQQLQPSLP